MRKVVLMLHLLCFVYLGSSQNDTWTAPKITDDMTVSPDQNKKWRMGEGKYSAKPKNMWELGIHTGHFFTDGDVDPKQPFSGWGIGLHARKAIHYVFSLRGDIFLGRTKGLDPQFTTQSVAARDLSETSAAGRHGGIYRNFKETMFAANLNGVVNIGNLLFHKERNKWNWYVFMGVGFDSNVTKLDVLKGNTAYDFSSVRGNVNSKSGRKEIKKQVRAISDGVYETQARKKVAIFRIGDKTNIHSHFSAGSGISRKISKRINLGIEHQLLSSDNDLLDGFVYRTELDQSNNNDLSHYTNIRLGINIGDFNKKTEPLYWLNPLDGVLNDVADLKQRPVLDLTDTDGDGVIDMIDQEKNSPTLAIVDTKGVSLDSDRDGIPDHLDKERYSPTGFNIDPSGVAQIVKEKNLTEDDVVTLINQRMGNINTNWFLPMIHFDLDKYYVKPDFYSQLHHVATVMKQHPEIKIVASGHTDVRKSDDYNQVLAWKRADAAVNYIVDKYGIPRDRFLLQFGGETTPMVANLPDNHNIPKKIEMDQYINRRVEFRVATATDPNMERPAGPDAGKNTPGSSRPGAKYSGNVNSGY